MRTPQLLALAAALGLALAAGHAMAFDFDTVTPNSPAAKSSFTDPDEQMDRLTGGEAGANGATTRTWRDDSGWSFGLTGGISGQTDTSGRTSDPYAPAGAGSTGFGFGRSTMPLWQGGR